MKISIIVPIYNSGKFLEQCVLSIQCQTYKNIEVILVNDGSTDESGEICEFFKANDPRIKVVHKENTGVADARNIGVGVATGDYISFVDSDDVLEVDMLEILISNLQEYNADISICEVFKEDKRSNFPLNAETKIISQKIALNKLFNSEINWGVYAKLFKKSHARKILFEGSTYEDLYYCFKIFSLCKNFVHSNLMKYRYRDRENSLSKTDFKPHFMSISDFTNRILIETSNKNPALVDEAKKLYIISNIALINFIIKSKNWKKFKKELNITILNLRDYHKFILFNKKLNTKYKLAYILNRYNPSLYSFIYKTFFTV